MYTKHAIRRTGQSDAPKKVSTPDFWQVEKNPVPKDLLEKTGSRQVPMRQAKKREAH
jgi:hypothetical protein